MNSEPITTVYITQMADTKIKRLVAHAPGEVGWYGVVENYQGHFLITDILVPYQVGTMGGQEEDGDALHKLLDEAGEDSDKLHCKGHSHPGMGFVTPSSTDLRAIDQWEKIGVEYILTHIVNKGGEYTLRLDIFKPYRVCTECEIKTLVSKKIDDWAKEIVEERVRKFSYTQSNDFSSHLKRSGKKGKEVIKSIITPQKSAVGNNGFRRGAEVEPIPGIDEDDAYLLGDAEFKELMEGNVGVL